NYASRMYEEIDQSDSKLRQYIDRSWAFTRKEPKVIKNGLDDIKEFCNQAHSQIKEYLSGNDIDENRKTMALNLLSDCNNAIKKLKVDSYDIRMINEEIYQ